MQVSLKKAAAYSKALQQQANKISAKATVSFDVYGITDRAHVEKVISKAEADLTDSLTAVEDIVHAAFEIRKLIGQANARAGVNDLMAELEAVKLVEKRLGEIVPERSVEGVTGGEAVSNVDAVCTRLESSKKRLENGGDIYPSDISVSVVSPSLQRQVKSIYARLRRQKSEISDAMAAKNATETVTLPVTIVNLLRLHEIIE